MDREAWQATVHGLARVGHDLVTKLPGSKIKKKKLENNSSNLDQFCL